MRKLEKRAILCLLLASILVLGMGFYIYKLARNGGDWVSFPANQNIYTNGYISTGSIYDTNGELLLKNSSDGQPQYNDSIAIRKATLHAIGDNVGNIATGANHVFADKLIGYNFLSGTYSTNNTGRNLTLTIDADICQAANEALNGRNGTVGVYNYKTGEIVCMVSSPNYDPTNPPTVSNDDTSGIYMNKFISSKIVPGSIFKVITATAAIETLDDYDTWTYYCTGTDQYGTADVDKVTDLQAHGSVNLEKALSVSCNCYFGRLANRIGKDTLKEYVKKAGLTNSYSINGIMTTPSSFEFPSAEVTLAWTGIGQYQDLVNPCSMMLYMGAIANGGQAAEPRIIESVKFTNGFPASLPWKSKTDELISSDTAKTLTDMLHNNVVETYGESLFPNLDLCAKSGTAEVGNGKNPNAWFTGFIRNEGYPYAFVVLVENGGYGTEVAGNVANTVLQKILEKDEYKEN